MSREYVLQPFRPPVNLRIDYARELNAQQHAAVTASPGPALVIAGAGAGKTRTLTYRVAFLLEQGIPADRILLLTFTNKAAREMMHRVTDLLGGELQALSGGTFHSIGHRMLRRHAELVGYQRDFTILDREDAKDLLKACIGAAEIDIKATRFPKPDVVADIFSLATNMQQSVAEVLAGQYGYFQQLAPTIESLHGRYTARKRTTNVVDFDDLLTLWLRLLREHPEVCEQYQRRFQFILVDEYQDTNKLQSDLIDLLAARHRNVMVVGDDSQSIYSWRGANFQNILEFPKRYPQAAVYKIEVNYRSTPEILNFANAAIAANVHQFAKQLAPVRGSGIKPAIVACNESGEQAAFVAQRVLELREEGVEMNKMAVLYRSHFHALELQLELTRRNIPFSITSGIRFFEQAHIKDVAAHLKFVCNPLDEVSFKRIVELLRGVGAKGADKLWNEFRSRFRLSPAPAPESVVDDSGLGGTGNLPVPSGDSPDGMGEGGVIHAASDTHRTVPLVPAGGLPAPPTFRTSSESDAPQPTGEGTANRAAPEPAAAPRAQAGVAAALRACKDKAPKKAQSDWQQLVETIDQLETDPVRQQPGRMIQVVMEAGYENYLQANFTNYRNRLEDLEQLANFSLQFTGPEDFLAQLALLTNLEAEQDGAVRRDDEQLRLSTIHQAKGLEFDVVFVIMLCDGLFPSARSLERPENEEEERRLFYVAVTRAKNELYLSYPLIRLTQGYGGDYMQQPSRFLKEIPKELFDEWNLRSYSPYQ